MSLFYPHIHLKNVCGITHEMLDSRGISALIIDIDNTLTSQDGFDILPEIQLWLDDIVKKYDCLLVSNNKKSRVEPFAQAVNLPYIHFAIKPVPFWGLGRALKILGKKARQVAVVGDQVFTDVAGGRLLGAISIRVEPLELTEKQASSFKRRLEAKITNKYLQNKGR